MVLPMEDTDKYYESRIRRYKRIGGATSIPIGIQGFTDDIKKLDSKV